MEMKKWINKPIEITKKENELSFTVLPKTDFWQVTHYRFSRTDGNCFVKEVENNVMFEVKVRMNYKEDFDQVGVIVYVDEENFAKVCVENQVHKKNKLGSVVCKDKRSDWATQSVEDLKELYFRVSKRDINYLFEYSVDGISYDQMRLFDIPKSNKVNIGVFGASPLGHGFKAEFFDMKFSDNEWVLDMSEVPDGLR